MQRTQNQHVWTGISAFVAASIAANLLVWTNGCRDAGPRAEAAPTVGSTLALSALRLVDLDDKPFDLKSSSTGKARVVVFTRSDCPISNRFAPEVRKLFDDFHSKGVDFFLIYVDPKEKPQVIREHLRAYEYQCAGLRDPEHKLVAQTGATVTPEAAVFDGKWQMTYRGRINDQYEDVGESRASSTKHDLREAIEATLDGRPIAEPITKAVGCYIGDLK